MPTHLSTENVYRLDLRQQQCAEKAGRGRRSAYALVKAVAPVVWGPGRVRACRFAPVIARQRPKIVVACRWRAFPGRRGARDALHAVGFGAPAPCDRTRPVVLVECGDNPRIAWLWVLAKVAGRH